VRSHPTGEVRPESHKLTPNQVRRRLALPRERCGAPSAAFERQCGLPHASNEGILAMESALSGDCRIRGELAQDLVAQPHPELDVVEA
jgi:hypothetical protein